MQFNSLELTVLNSILFNKNIAIDFISNFQDAKLFSSDLWMFASHVISYIKTYKEPPTLKVLCEKNTKPNSLEYYQSVWKAVESTTTDPKEFKYYLDQLKKEFASKQLLSLKDNLSSDKIDISKTVLETKKKLQIVESLNQTKSYERKTIKQHLPDFKESFLRKKEDPTCDRGISTGYSFFDWATNGVKPSDFVIIAGESGHGKSLMLNNMAIQMWLQNNSPDKYEEDKNFSKGCNITYFSLEMPYENCFNRVLARLSGINYKRLENSNLSKDEKKKLKKALDFIHNYPYEFDIIDIPYCASPNDLETILNDVKDNYIPDTVFVDYLGIMKPNSSSEESDWLKQGIISYEIREILRKNKVPGFTAVQLNRKAGQAKDSSENIGLHRLARSASIATHATTVIQIEARNQEDMHPDLMYHIIKNRNGPKGKGRMIKHLAYSTLIDDPIDLPDQNYDPMDQDDISDDLEDVDEIDFKDI